MSEGGERMEEDSEEKEIMVRKKFVVEMVADMINNNKEIVNTLQRFEKKR